MLETPLVFIVFNRPETTQKVWERIRTAKPKRLFVIADGARIGLPAEQERCAEVRKIVERTDWACEVSREYSTENLGVAARVSSGLNWVFSQVEEAIILEDDCLPDPTFFPFCTELLQRYRDEPKVAQIAGCSFQNGSGEAKSSYYFSKYPHIWGWATWRRAWRNYDHSMQVWRDNHHQEWLARHIEHPAERQTWARCFDETLAGKVDTWDYRWVLAVWNNHGLSICPYRNLVSNIGFGAGATHTRKASPWAAMPLVPMPFPLVHPVALVRNQSADERTSRLVFRPPSWAMRISRKFRHLISISR